MFLKKLKTNLWIFIHKIFYNYFLNKAKLIPKNTPINVINSDDYSVNLSNTINDYLEEIDLNKEIKKLLKKLPLKLRYRVDLYNLLDINLKAKIVHFALFHKKIREFNFNYFGFHPRIHKIELLYNLPNKDLIEEGSKSWHRDLDCDLKNIKLFLPLKKITPENGPFYYLKDKNYQSRFVALKTNKLSDDEWKRGRVSNKIIESESNKIDSFLSLKNGSSLLIDTVNIYHKGGFCKSDTRLLIHISYQGNGWSSTKPQDISKEIYKLSKNESNKNNIQILRNELENYRRYINSPLTLRLIRKFIYKLSNFFIYEKD